MRGPRRRTAAGSWPAPAEAALREVVAVQRARDHAGLAGQAQVALQALGQPGAARPDADQRARRACSRPRARRAAARRRALRRRAGRGALIGACSLRNCSRMIAAARRVEIARAGAPAPRSSCSARRPRAPAGRSAPRSWRREAARAARCCRAPRRRDGSGTPTTSASGCHSAISARDRREAGASPSRATVRSGVARAQSASCRSATPMRLAPKSKARKDDVEAGDGHTSRRSRAALMRAPPPG